MHGEIIHCPEIIERLHKHKSHPDYNSRPGQRHGDPEEPSPRSDAKGAARIQRARGLGEKGGPRQQVDIRIKHQRHHGDRPAKGTDFGKPVVLAVAPPEYFPKSSLDRTRVFENVGEYISRDVGRHGQGKKQRPFEYASPREFAHGDEPRGSSADRQCSGAHAEHEEERRLGIMGQDGRSEVLPYIFGWSEGQGHDSDQRRGDEEGDQAGSQNPPVGTQPGAQPGSREIVWTRGRRPQVPNFRLSLWGAVTNEGGPRTRQVEASCGMLRSGSGAQVKTDLVDEFRRDAPELSDFGQVRCVRPDSAPRYHERVHGNAGLDRIFEVL